MDEENIKDRRLNKEEYNNLLKMLKSSEEDAIIALNCIKSFDLKKTAIQVMFLRKESEKNKLWSTHCPTILEYHNSICSSLSFSDIQSCIKMLDDPEFNLNFFLERFAYFMKNSLSSSFSFIDDIEINLKFKQ